MRKPACVTGRAGARPVRACLPRPAVVAPALAGLLLFAAACATTRPYVEPSLPAVAEPPAVALRYQVFLAGDAGAAGAEAPALDLLHAHLAAAGPDAAVVFLGDNTRGGLPDSGAAGRAEAEARLRRLAETVAGFAGRVVVLPGDADWSGGRPGGAEAVRRQEAFVEGLLGRGDTFVPDGGLPGPVEVDLADGLALVVLDTQWWLTAGDKPFGDAGGYDLDEAGDVVRQLADVVRRRDDDLLVVVGHHPLVSNGPHAGFFPARTHLFPLTALHPGAYVPLPVVGSAYPLYRRYVGTTQDLARGRYRTLRDALAGHPSGVFAAHERLVYAGAHDRSLQYFDDGARHYLVSGAAGAADYAAPGRGAAFTAARPGFFLLKYYEDGSAWVEAVEADGSAQGRVLFRRELFGPAPGRVPAEDGEAAVSAPDYTDSVAVLAANPAYAAGPVKRFFFGRQHRDVWATPVAVPYLDLGRTAGGLTPFKRGGGQQTRSLRLEGADGREYVLRSIDKDPSGTVPVRLQGTIATDVVQDGISSLHPYGAFVVPVLAEAAGVYHTNPRPVFVPDDPRLGPYREDFGGRLMMFEERPDGDMSDVPGYGGAKDVVGPAKLYAEVDGDNDHRVDQRAFARARLFDMLLSDWDRHRDQWRWAAFEPFELDSTLEGEARTAGKVYRPVPRDRDAAFNAMNGLFPTILSYVIPKFQDFTPSYGYLPGLTLNGMEQDRRFTNALTRQDWVEIAEDLRRRLDDSVAAAAFRGWPPPVYALHGERMLGVFKARREQLPRVAGRFYELMARVVDVVGSDKHERFEVYRRTGGETEVVVYKTKRDGTVQGEVYRRTFVPAETREVRLYGLGGDDRFVIEGEAERGIRVVVVGGTGADTFDDRSRVAGLRRRTHIYDTAEGNTWQAGPETRVVGSRDPLVNRYDSRAYRHDYAAPLTYFGYNQDDGVYLGGGVRLVRFGFRKAPYAGEQKLRANFAAAPGAFNVRYEGHFVGVAGAWDVRLKADWFSPDNVRNFYGLGNETANDVRDAHYYQANLRRVALAPALERSLGAGLRFRAGPTLTFTDVRFDAGRFIGRPQAGVAPGTFDDHTFAGLLAEAEVDTRDGAVNPKQGFRWTGGAHLHAGLGGQDDRFARLTTELALYASPSLSPQVTLALRAGAAHHAGDFPFYEAATLGGRDNLRGYRGTRFAGRTAVFQNVDLRVKLFDLRSYLVLGEAGLVGFVDNGRVWTDGERSAAWHQGYGGGLWASLFDTAVVTATLDASVEERAFTLKLGFFY